MKEETLEIRYLGGPLDGWRESAVPDEVEQLRQVQGGQLHVDHTVEDESPALRHVYIPARGTIFPVTTRLAMVYRGPEVLIDDSL